MNIIRCFYRRVLSLEKVEIGLKWSLGYEILVLLLSEMLNFMLSEVIVGLNGDRDE